MDGSDDGLVDQTAVKEAARLVKTDPMMKKSVGAAAAKRTNFHKDARLFSNLVSLDTELPQEIRPNTARRRLRNVKSRYMQTNKQTMSRERQDVDLKDRTQPDINDFWNPEWEIARPNWSLPFDDPADVVTSYDPRAVTLEIAMDDRHIMDMIEKKYFTHLDGNEWFASNQ